MGYITPNHTYDGGWITLPNLKLEGLPGSVEVNGNKLFLKSEFHITMICAKDIAKIISRPRTAETEKQIAREFVEFAKTYGLEKYILKNKFYLVKNGERETVIVLCEVSGLREFFDLLQRKFGVKLPLQPAHITLYTLQRDAGIGILSHDELERIGEPVKLPSLQIKSYFINLK